jgi:hypothetical protein
VFIQIGEIKFSVILSRLKIGIESKHVALVILFPRFMSHGSVSVHRVKFGN